ncbi:MAG: hypothetical protein AAGF79_13845 [Pseudomonadota bacterium]
MNDATALGLLFGGAFLLWAGSLALFWRVFRTWQYLMDAMARCPASVLDRLGWPVLSPFDEGSVTEVPRTQNMALQTRVFGFGLPADCPEDARGYARRFRRSVLGLTLILCGLTVIVVRLEPALFGASRAFFAGLFVWGLFHVALLFRWRLWPGGTARA